MNVGTKSLLFGVHQIFWHPVTVALAWRRLYGCWPNWRESVAIFFHDWGYFGKPNMDGKEGEDHPWGGAEIAYKVTHDKNIFFLTLLHSRFMAAQLSASPSKLCWADKLSIWFEPRWWYLLRARLSGEVKEYRLNAVKHVPLFAPDRVWFDWYRERVIDQIKTKRPATVGHHKDE